MIKKLFPSNITAQTVFFYDYLFSSTQIITVMMKLAIQYYLAFVQFFFYSILDSTIDNLKPCNNNTYNLQRTTPEVEASIKSQSMYSTEDGIYMYS